MTARDVTGFFLTKLHSKSGEKGTTIHWRKFKKSSRDSAPKLQISVPCLDDRQITHLICVRLKLLLYDFLGGIWGILRVVFPLEKAQSTP